MDGLRMALPSDQFEYGICVQEIYEVYFPSTMHTIEFVVSSKTQTYQEAQEWCPKLRTDRPFEIITPFGDEEEDYFLNYAENFWIGLSSKTQEIKDQYKLYELTDQNLQ